jgi:murein L,D-transpeptidase YafK
VASALAPGLTTRPGDEDLLVKALTNLLDHRLDDALSSVEALVKRNPGFRLAQLVYGDLLMAKARPVDRVGGPAGDAGQEALTDFVAEARARLEGHLGRPPSGSVPHSLLQLSAQQRWAVVVDVRRSRLYLLENRSRGPRLVDDYYAATGKNGAVKERQGDRRTPTGVYFVAEQIPGRALPNFYGAGALPINYPNEWDRRLGKTGHGIWLHGVPSDTYSRPPRSSDGCVTLANADLTTLFPYMRVGETPVIIADEVQWTDPRRLAGERRQLLAALDQWRRDWETRDPERLVRNYSKDFRTPDLDHGGLLARKGQLVADTRFIRVKLSNVSLLAYPDNPALVVATFDQHYRSNNLERQLRKRLYWQREADGVWRIVYEGSA